MGILNFVLGSKVQRRENVGGSLESLGPTNTFASDQRFCPFDNTKYNTTKTVCQVCLSKKLFGQLKNPVFLGNRACCRSYK